MIRMQKMKKLILLVNSFLMGYVLLMMAFYACFGITYMVYHSIPTAALYILFYFLIKREQMDVYVKLLYISTAIYMVAATVCLGQRPGFHLYCWALVTVTFYLDYLAHIMQTEKVNALKMSIFIVIVYLFCMWYSSRYNPVYTLDPKIISICMYFNIFTVFSFLICYSSFIHKLIIESEDRLSDLAHLDQLTGLFNRRSMIEHMDNIFLSVTPQHWLAMVDIDDFKKFNDTYGHNCGDYVLVEITKIMRNVCQGCVISRWGGEEFLIATDGISLDPAMLELFRQAVERTNFSYEGIDLHLTVTIGIANYEPDQSLDKWIQHADDNLYEGKRSGKNRIVY